MPLDSVNVDLPIPGLKQSEDARVVPVQGASELRNYLVERLGALRRRDGFSGPAFASGIPMRATPIPGGALHVLRADGTCVTTADLGATLSQPQINAASQQERNFAPFAAPQVLAREAFAAQGSVGNRAQVHAARTQNFFVLAAYVNTDSGSSEVVLSVYDADGTPLAVGQRTGILANSVANAANLVLISEQANDNVLLITNASGTPLVARRFAVSAAGCAQAAQSTIATLPSALSLWDAALGAPGTFWMVADNGTTGVALRPFDTTTLAAQSAGSNAAIGRPSALSIHVSGNRMAIATIEQGTNAQKGSLINTTTGGNVGLGVTSGATPTLPKSVAACVVNPSATGAQVAAVYFWSAKGDNAIVNPITGVTSTRAQAQNGAGGSIGSGVAWVGVRPSAKPFAIGSTRCIAFFDVLQMRAAGSTVSTGLNPDQADEPGFATVAVEALSVLESGAPAVAQSPEPLAWHNLARASAATQFSRLAASVPLSDGTYLACLTALDRAELRITYNFTKPDARINALTVRGLAMRYPPNPGGWFAAVQPARPFATAGATALIAGAAPCLAQGRGVTPAGYLHPPEIMGARQTVTGTSAVWPDAFISIRARYVWYDVRGNELVSPWSLPSQIATPTGVANTRIDVYVRNPFAWPGDATSERHPAVEVAVASGATITFKRALLIDLTAAAAGPFNTLPTNVGASVQIGLTANNLTQTLVVTNDLANDPPPCASFVAAGQSRHLLVSPEDDAVYFSKPAITGVLPEWSIAFVLAPSGSTGRPVAAVEINDQKLLIGDAGACYYVGDGPLADGSGAFFSGPYEAARGHGCVSAASVCQSPGVAFWRTKHTIVAFAGQVEVIGRDVQDELDAMPFTLASCYDPTLNAVLWLVADEFNLQTAILIYDLTHKAWFVWECPGLGVLSDLAADATGLYLTGGSKTTRYDAEGLGDGFDAGTTNFPTGRVRSQAARLDSINGFQRVWAVEVEYESFEASNTLTLRCYRDGAATPDPDIVSKPLGTGVGICKFHLPAHRQRCSTMAIELEDGQPNGPDVAPAGVSILGVTLRIAGKRGIRTVPATRRA